MTLTLNYKKGIKILEFYDAKDLMVRKTTGNQQDNREPIDVMDR